MSEPTIEAFDLDRFSESVKSLKQKSARIDPDYWTRETNVNWRLAKDETDVSFPSDFTTIKDRDGGTYFRTHVFLHSRDMTHHEAAELAVRLGKLLGASEEQLAKLGAWPEASDRSLGHVVAVEVNTNRRSYNIKIRDAYDLKLPARLLLSLYDTTNATIPKLNSGGH